MSWFEWLLLVVFLSTLAAMVGIAVRIRQSESSRRKIIYNGPVLPKTYNDRYPKRSSLLVDKSYAENTESGTERASSFSEGHKDIT